jgi:hypothetical protein
LQQVLRLSATWQIRYPQFTALICRKALAEISPLARFRKTEIKVLPVAISFPKRATPLDAQQQRFGPGEPRELPDEDSSVKLETSVIAVPSHPKTFGLLEATNVGIGYRL